MHVSLYLLRNLHNLGTPVPARGQRETRSTRGPAALYGYGKCGRPRPGCLISEWSCPDLARAGVRKATAESVAIQNNHRWTQIHTDKNCSEPPFSMATTHSRDSDPKQCETRLKSSPQDLCSSVSICGFLLPGYG